MAAAYLDINYLFQMKQLHLEVEQFPGVRNRNMSQAFLNKAL